MSEGWRSRRQSARRRVGGRAVESECQRKKRGGTGRFEERTREAEGMGLLQWATQVGRDLQIRVECNLLRNRVYSGIQREQAGWVARSVL